jgi:hypothetical protein
MVELLMMGKQATATEKTVRMLAAQNLVGQEDMHT